MLISLERGVVIVESILILMLHETKVFNSDMNKIFKVNAKYFIPSMGVI